MRAALPLCVSAVLVGAAGCSTTPTDTSAEQAPAPTQSDSAAGADDSSPGDADNADAANTDAGTSDPATRDIVADPPTKTAHDALAAAQKLFDGKPSKIELEWRHNTSLEYKVELVSAQETYEVKFDAETLEVLKEELETLDADDNDLDEVFTPGDVVDLDVAAGAASKAQEGTIREWKLEGKDDGRVLYEFDIVPPGVRDDIEVKVDAFTGDVVS